MSERAGAAGERAAIAAVAVSLLLVATHQLVALDLWWQLAAGKWIAQHGLPSVDPFSFGYPGRPWIEQRWLFFLTEHALASQFGLNALVAAKLAWLLACFALLERAMRPAPRWARALGLMVAVLALHSRLKVRPELASYAGVIGFLWVYQVCRHTRRDRWLWLLPAIQLVWSNTHTLWIVGPALAWTAWALEAVLARLPRAGEAIRVLPALPPERRRALAGVALAVTLVSVVTPYLFLGQIYPTTILEQIGVGSKLRELIVELKSPLSQIHDPVFFGSYLAVLAASFGCMLLPVRPPAFRIAVWAGFVGFTFLAARNVALLGPVAGWVIAHQLGDWWQAGGRERRPGLARAAVGVATLVALALSVASATDWLWRSRGWHQRFGTGVREWVYPIEAMAFVERHELPRPVLSGLADASYLIYEGGERSVFIDGRLEVYGADAVLDNARSWADAANVMADADRYDIDTVLLSFPLMNVAISGFEASPDWTAVYYDAGRVLYLRRTDRTREALAKLALDWNATPRPRAALPLALTPRDWGALVPRVPDVSEPFDRAMLLLHVGAAEAAESALGEVLAVAPADREARLYLGLLAELARDEQTAAEHFAHLGARRLAEPEAHGLRLELARLRGDGRQRFDAALGALGAELRTRRVLETLVEHAVGAERSEQARRAVEAAIARGDPPDDGRLHAVLNAIAQRARAPRQ